MQHRRLSVGDVECGLGIRKQPRRFGRQCTGGHPPLQVVAGSEPREISSEGGWDSPATLA